MLKIAVMQPYFMPYIGYFQMIKAVDKFVFYDDVNFIKQGWVNRNRILVNGEAFLYTIPLDKANSFCFIQNTLINEKFYAKWKQKFLQTINQNYKKAPYFSKVYSLLEDVLEMKINTISELAIESIMVTSKYLGLQTEFLISSTRYNNKDLQRQDRLLDICKKENATHYINAVGGQELYAKESFKEKDVELNFIKSKQLTYKQFGETFTPWLSIIDVLMFNSKEEVNIMLDQYELL